MFTLFCSVVYCLLMTAVIIDTRTIRDSPEFVPFDSLETMLISEYRNRPVKRDTVCSLNDFLKPEVQQAVTTALLSAGRPSIAPSNSAQFPFSGNQEEMNSRCSEDTGSTTSSMEFKIDMPLEMRSVCSYVYVENVNEKRLPKIVPEVRCTCDRPSSQIRQNYAVADIRCEPVYFEMQVLVFDADCATFEAKVERVPLACAATISPSSQSTFIGVTQIGQSQETYGV